MWCDCITFYGTLTTKESSKEKTAVELSKLSSIYTFLAYDRVRLNCGTCHPCMPIRMLEKEVGGRVQLLSSTVETSMMAKIVYVASFYVHIAFPINIIILFQ